MRFLQRGRNRFETRLQTQTGVVFRGTIQPISETALSVDSFAEPRKLMRVRNGEPVKPRDIITDPWGVVMLVGTHDGHLTGDAKLDRVHKLFQMTESTTWQREVMTIEPVTGRQVSSALATLGTIWIARELYGRDQMDRGLRVAEERNRVITGADIQLGDRIGDAVVVRLLSIYGISLAEIQ